MFSVFSNIYSYLIEAYVVKSCDAAHGQGEPPMIKLNVADVLTAISPPEVIPEQAIVLPLESLHVKETDVPPPVLGMPG